MKKPKYVYHGSPNLIKDKFKIQSPRDLNKNPDNTICGVYASSSKNKAIGMGICGVEGVKSSGMGFGIGNRRKGVIYEGWPRGKYFYLYYFDSSDFIRTPKNSTQFVATKEVLPVKIEKLKVKDYLYTVRRASKNEVQRFLEKHGLNRKSD